MFFKPLSTATQIPSRKSNLYSDVVSENASAGSFAPSLIVDNYQNTLNLSFDPHPLGISYSALNQLDSFYQHALPKGYAVIQ
jgi:hypothetical protein